MQEYWEYNYVETTKIVDEEEQRLPAITFCNVNWFSRALVKQKYPITDIVISAYFTNTNSTEGLAGYTQEEIDAEMNEKYYNLVLNTTYAVDDLLVACRLDYRQPAHNCSQHVSRQLTDQGECARP